MTALQINTQVRLASGGPVMTITRLDGDTARCIWFVGGVPESGDFPTGALVKHNPAADGPMLVRSY